MSLVVDFILIKINLVWNNAVFCPVYKKEYFKYRKGILVNLVQAKEIKCILKVYVIFMGGYGWGLECRSLGLKLAGLILIKSKFLVCSSRSSNLNDQSSKSLQIRLRKLYHCFSWWKICSTLLVHIVLTGSF